MVRKPVMVSITSLIEYIEQSGSKQVENDKKVRILICKSRNFIMTIAVIKLVSKKLLTILAKEALKKDVQDVKVRKI